MSEDNKTVVRRFAEECWGRGVLAAADELVAEDVRRNGQPIGRAGLTDVISAIRSALPDYRRRSRISSPGRQGRLAVLERWIARRRGPARRSYDRAGCQLDGDGDPADRGRSGQIMEIWTTSTCSPSTPSSVWSRPQVRDARSMRRVSVVGISGAGKTTLARRLAGTLSVPHVELDAIFHQPGWTELPVEAFRRRVHDELVADGWVVDGNYGAVRDLVWAAADTVVWLDRPRATVMRRLIARTARRAITREELWNGNREPLTGMFRRDPRANLVRWSWMKHGEYAERYASATTDPRNLHLTFWRVRSDAEVDELIASAG